MNKAASSSIYAQDAILEGEGLDIINAAEAHTLDELFRERVRRTPDKVAYRQYDLAGQQWQSFTWANLANEVERWQVALRAEGLQKGERIALHYRNSVEWVVVDQAALRLGLVVVPVYTADRADNIAYVLENSAAKVLVTADASGWNALADCGNDLSAISRVLLLNPAENDQEDELVRKAVHWLPETGQHLERGLADADDLASIVYTSGTTGKPKGVMLSHKNILSNAYNSLRSVAIRPDDCLLSFLPLSHMLERTVGYYAPMTAGGTVVFNRSIEQLSADIQIVKPTILVSVPRIFERVQNTILTGVESGSALTKYLFRKMIEIGWHRFEYQQGRKSWNPKLMFVSVLDTLVASKIKDALGGQLRMCIVGGAPLSLPVAKTFIASGVTLLQGYGLTEASPVVSVNTLDQNSPDSIGLPLRGVNIKLGENQELLVSGDNVMQGYWLNESATNDTFDGEWLKTGDRASIDDNGFIRIIGRIKDILVLANGEKVPPADIEAAIMQDSLFEQVLVLGEGRSFLSALVVINQETLDSLEGGELPAMPVLLARVAEQMKEFPGYARIRKLGVCQQPWTIDNGLLTPTLKVKRAKVVGTFKDIVDQIYAGH